MAQLSNTQITGSLFIGSSTKDTGSLGNIFYDPVTCTVQYIGYIRAWSVGGTMGQARNALGGAGTQNAGLAFGGATPTVLDSTEEYNNGTWSSSTGLAVGRRNLTGTGPQLAGLAFGGAAPAIVQWTEAYNGDTWATQNVLTTGRQYLGGAGVQDATLAFGGSTPTTSTCTEAFDGSDWSTCNRLNSNRVCHAGTGTQNAALAIEGSGAISSNRSEQYNGTTWSSIANINGDSKSNPSAFGTQNAAVLTGGNRSSVHFCFSVEEYDGTSWTVGGPLLVSRGYHAGGGSINDGFVFGGYRAPTRRDQTEEYNEVPGLHVRRVW